MSSSAVVEKDGVLTKDVSEGSLETNGELVTSSALAEPEANRLTKTLNSLRLENRWNECLDTWEDADPEEVLEVHLMAAQVRQQFLDAASPITSEEELEQAAVLIYIQLRAHWYLLNLRLGYSAETGILDQPLAYQASLLAILVLIVEATVGRRVIESVSAMLDTPLTDFDSPAVVAEADSSQAPPPAALLATNSFSSIATSRGDGDWATGADEEEAGTLRGRVQSLADTLGDLSERLSRQSGEMLVMKATQGALTETLGEADPARLIARVMQLNAKIVSLEAQLESAGIHRELFEREFGTSEPFAMATVVQSLRAQVASQAKSGSSASMGDIVARNTSAAVQAISATRIEELTAALQTEREAKVQAQAQNAALETQLQTLRAGQELLASELGLTDAPQIVAKVKSLTDRLAAVKDLEALLGTMEAELSGSST